MTIARRSRTIALQSVLVGMGLVVRRMLFGAFGLLVPVAGALFQEAIDVAVILNALRALARRARRIGRAARPSRWRSGSAQSIGSSRPSSSGSARSPTGWATLAPDETRRELGQCGPSCSNACRSTKRRRRPSCTRSSPS